MSTYYGNVIHEEDRIYAEIWINRSIYFYPLCSRDLEFVKTLDEERLATLTEVEFKIVDGEAVMQEPEDETEPQFYYE